MQRNSQKLYVIYIPRDGVLTVVTGYTVSWKHLQMYFVEIFEMMILFGDKTAIEMQLTNTDGNGRCPSANLETTRLRGSLSLSLFLQLPAKRGRSVNSPAHRKLLRNHKINGHNQLANSLIAPFVALQTLRDHEINNIPQR